MPEQPIRTCIRCGHRHVGAPLAPAGLPTMHLCPLCGLMVVVREMGEMSHRDDRADPDQWGHLGTGT